MASTEFIVDYTINRVLILRYTVLSEDGKYCVIEEWEASGRLVITIKPWKVPVLEEDGFYYIIQPGGIPDIRTTLFKGSFERLEDEQGKRYLLIHP